MRIPRILICTVYHSSVIAKVMVHDTNDTELRFTIMSIIVRNLDVPP